MDNKATTKRMIGAVVLVLVAALLLAWLLKGKNRDGQQDLAMNQTAETKPILGFPGVGGDEKPSVVGEDQTAAAPSQQPGADGAVAPQQDTGAAPSTTAQGGAVIPGVEVKMPETVPNTTGLSVRPGGGEVRDLVDTDGKVKEGKGSMGAGDAKPVDVGAGQETTDSTGKKPTDEGHQQAAASQPPASGSSASQQDKPVSSAPAEKKSSGTSSKVVLVNEKPVPKSQSEESAKAKAAAEKAAAEKAAAAKEAAAKAAAEKAAAEKSKALAAAGATATGAAAGAAASGDFAIQVIASSDKAKADAIAGPLKADGYNVTVASASVSGKTVYRVSVGGFADKAAAEAAQVKMKSRYKQNQNVQSSFVVSNK
ncbi:SPOR domain-containing protein [Candidatus Thiothrix sp. Deng01]|uniref:SPOR domain-containing protein n=1 Tax=Candidatus Thiothrix phosphatis TaxID=3112415 RepID=A0ABU6CYL3_9GAMM|nr:SPOR domain-containing protein [Candidatus Thiothrix sp. Deng01]MEB4591925.1 SPOR domain-containing protein [Candidatus Thiothrix sp. Deng01]